MKQSPGKLHTVVVGNTLAHGYYDPAGSFIWHRDHDLPSFGGAMAYSYFKHEIRNRLNGPAQLDYTTQGTRWYVCGQRVSPREYFEWLEENNIDINNITDEDKLLIALRWSE